jgi:hypothetical protein
MQVMAVMASSAALLLRRCAHVVDGVDCGMAVKSMTRYQLIHK